MANATTYNVGAYAGGNGLLARVRKAIADYRTYRQTIDELASLSDRELADLGLSRFSVREIAYQSVYGK